jgi:hypothetical protein
VELKARQEQLGEPVLPMEAWEMVEAVEVFMMAEEEEAIMAVEEAVLHREVEEDLVGLPLPELPFHRVVWIQQRLLRSSWPIPLVKLVSTPFLELLLVSRQLQEISKQQFHGRHLLAMEEPLLPVIIFMSIMLQHRL